MAQHAHDIGAERALLGAIILNHVDALPAFLAVPERAYYRPAHQVIAGIIRDMVVTKRPVDQITVLSALEESGQLFRVGAAPYLHTLCASPHVAGNAAAYAERIMELYGRRRLWEELTRDVQRLDADWDTGEEGFPVEAALSALRATCDELAGYALGVGEPDPMSLNDLLRGEDHFDWLVPGLIERSDRLILTGAEGFGKSELVAQLALCIAASLHPFTADLLTGVEPRVLIVDCENSQAQTRRRLRRIAGAVDRIRSDFGGSPIDWGKRIRMEWHPAGLDLLKGSDVAHLERLVSATGPDLLVLGPLYKLHTTNINDNTAARQILDVFDRLRERHGCALMTEAHASKVTDGNGSRLLVPEGSSLFMRWPEFGFGLRRSKDDPEQQADVISWRGQREERAWPSGLMRSSDGRLPWCPTPDYWDRPDPGWRG